MPWTQEQNLLLFEAYWQDGEGTCPTCKTPVLYQYHPYQGGYGLVGRCPRGCGSFSFGMGDDPKRGSFRNWTPEEIDALISVHHAQEVPRCPVDGARVEVSELYLPEGRNRVQPDCPRCGQQGERFFPPR